MKLRVILYLLAAIMVSGELAAQSPAHRDRAEMRERVRSLVGAHADDRHPLHLLALQPLVFEPAGAGEARVVDPLMDQDVRGEFEIFGDGWVEVTVTVRREVVEDASLSMDVQPGDVVFFDPSGRQLGARTVEHLRERGGLTLRMEVQVSGSALLFIGGAVAPQADHAPGRYSSRVLVSARYLDE